MAKMPKEIYVRKIGCWLDAYPSAHDAYETGYNSAHLYRLVENVNVSPRTKEKAQWQTRRR